jgi:hypothetical protein
MATKIESFRESIRTLLGDNHPTIKNYHQDQLDAAVRLVVRLGKAPGVTLSTDGLSVEPTITPFDTQQGKNWARIVLNSAKRFIITDSAAGSFRTRALSESFGERREMVFDILNEVYSLECQEGGE